jgi:zinc protease
MTAAMLTQGTSNRSALQLADQRALIAADIGAGADLDTSTVSLSVLTERLDPALDLFADVLLNPVFPQSDLDRLKKNALANIEQEKVDPIGVALRVLPGLLYGPGHAYSQPLTGSGTEASVNAMTRADLAAFHQAWFKPNRATLVVAGDITMEALTPKLERVSQGLEAAGTGAHEEHPDGAGARARPDLHRRSTGRRTERRDFRPADRAEEEPGRVRVHDVQRRVRRRVWLAREPESARGQALVVRRGQLRLRRARPAMWIVYAPVQTDKTRESVIEVIKELKAVVDDKPITAVEVQEAKDRQTRTMAGRWETTGAIRSALQEIATFDLPPDYYATFRPEGPRRDTGRGDGGGVEVGDRTQRSG